VSARKCPACGAQFRSGTLSFMLEGGTGKRGGGRGLRGVIVCGACAKGGVLLVAPMAWIFWSGPKDSKKNKTPRRKELDVDPIRA
jgi:hypothetical protein